MTEEAKKELAALKTDQELLKAMKRSTVDADKKLAERIQDFCANHLGIPKGTEFTILDLVEKANQ